MNPKEQSELLDALLDGEISDADFLRLEAELTVDPQVRQAYYKRLQLDLLLEEEASQEASTPPQQVPQPAVGGWGNRWWLTGVLVAIAAGLIGIVSLSPWNQIPSDQQPSDGNPIGRQATAELPKDEPSATGFAVLAGQSDAVWENVAIAPGELLPEGKLHLKSGLVHLELFSGVQMVVQGDAEFSIDSPMQVSMSKGRARTHVPEPAKGFRLKTAGGDVVDLGTEFTVDVSGGRSSVSVVDGEVELHPNDSNVRRLRDGEGVQMVDDGTVRDESSDRIDLVGPAAFQGELARRQGNQFETWKRSLETLRTDPRLIAHYSVDPDSGWSRQLTNRATSQYRKDNAPVAGAGAVVAAARGKDRWGRTGGALDFSPMGSRVRVAVPGEHRGLTLSCWVKINSLDRWYNSLFLTDGHEEREPHWQIMDDGRLFFSVKPIDVDDMPENQRERQIFYSPPFWNTSMSGRWIMLSTVYDVDQKQVTHFVNGQAISAAAIPNDLLVQSIKIGSASVCNWSQPMYRTDATFVVRNLNGSVDEFSLFSGALSADEILNLYESGNPYDQ